MRFCKKIIFVFVLALIALVTVAVNVQAIDDVTGFTYMMSTQFGEDSATEINISFCSNSKSAYVEYTLATDTAFANATKVTGTPVQLGDDFGEYLDSIPDVDTRYYTQEDYNYEIYLTGLTPKTQYIYRVTDGKQYSDVYKFKTSAGKGETDQFTFAYIADPQLYSSSSENLYFQCLEKATAMAEQNKTPIDFLIGGGDMIESGGDAYWWNRLLSAPLIKEVPYMAVAGNHEYTALKSSMGLDGRFYCINYNNPKNGTPEYGKYIESSYYYTYNDVLFVMLCSSGAERKDQVAWVEKVLSENTAQFIIVTIHYPVNSTAADNCNFFVPVFDKYGVDLVLYGHEHTFKLHENYYNFKKTNETGLGTTYLQMGSPDKANPQAIYGLITVNKDLIQINNYSTMGVRVQSPIIKARRTATKDLGEFSKETFENSIQTVVPLENQTVVDLSWDKTAYNNVEYINLYDEAGNQISSTYVMGDVVTKARITGLTLNTEYKVKVEIIYTDGTTAELSREFNTNEIIGELQEVTVDQTSSKFRILYTPYFKDSVKSLNVYVNGEVVQTAKTSDKRILIDLEKFVEGQVNTVSVKAVKADGTEVEIFATTYGEAENEALKAAKEAAVSSINAKFAGLKASDYEANDYAKIEEAKAKALESVEAAADEAAVSAAVSAFEKAVADTPVKGLDAAKIKEAKDEVNAFIAGYKAEDYTAEEWAKIQEKLTKVLADLDKCKDEAALKAAVDGFKAAVKAAPVKPEEPKDGCNKGASLLFTSFLLLGLCLIRRKK